MMTNSKKSTNKQSNNKQNTKNIDSTKATEKVTIYIDDVPYQVDKENNLLAGVLSQKLKLPYFCWHPSMGSVGACRQCAVMQYQDENDTRGRMVMSCMTPVSEGMRIGLTDKTSTKFREQVISAMMTNHPHDCPVCAEGGECHLQDMTVMTGHTARHYQGKKRTFNNQNLGELVGHEMNRCITCYRCVRFYKDYAGGEDFGAYGSKNQVYFGRQTDGTLESEFAGNLVEVCPTGVFTNKVFSTHFSRKWDLQSSPSVCSYCSVGCNTSIGERYGSVRRVMNRYNSTINGYFLCDRGRYGIGAVNASNRLKQTKGLHDENEALNELSIAKKLAHHAQERFIAIGSARASFEANRLLKQLVGRTNFSLGYSNNEMQLAVQHKQLLAQYPQPSLHAIEQHNDLVIIIGEDINQTAPRLALSVKQVLRKKGIDRAATIGIKPWQDSAVRTYAGNELTPLYSLQAKTTSFDKSAKQALVLSPEQLIATITEVTHLLSQFDPQNVVAMDKNEATNDSGNQSDNNKEISPWVGDFITALQAAEKPLLITGLSLQTPELLAAIEKLMACIASDKLACSPELIVVAPQCNSVGNLHLLNEQTLSLEQIQDKLLCQQADSLILLEQDLLSLTATKIAELRAHCKTLIVLEHHQSELATLADITMPVAAVSESDGHFVNYQGVLQAFAATLVPAAPIMSNWRWLIILAKTLFSHNHNHDHFSVNNNFRSLTQLHHYFAEQGEAWAVQILQAENSDVNRGNRGVAQQTHRASGRTAMIANQTMHEPKTVANSDRHYHFSMEGSSAEKSDNLPFTWAPSWNSNQAILQHQQEVNGDLINQQQENWLMFSFDEQLNDLWQNEVLESNASVDQDKLTLVQNLPWFLVDSQARVIPEFTLMFTGNTIELSPQLAEGKNLSKGSIAVITTAQGKFFATVKISKKLPDDLVVASIFELSCDHNMVAVTLTNASPAQVTQFNQQYEQRQQYAQQEKHHILARLKIQDQHIPIHLTSGGFDHA